jgi:DNA-binding NarL/FixJ family response regulator
MIPTKKIRVILAEDHEIVSQGLRTLLETDGAFDVVAQAKDGREAVKLTSLLKPDVIVMDIAMPILNGLEATRQILAQNSNAKILILSAHSDDEYIEHVTSVGAAGFLEKQTSADMLTRAIRDVSGGKTVYSPTITRRIAANKILQSGRDGTARSAATKLTSREIEVLQLVAEGHANKQVASMLEISIKTVEKHRQRLMDKLNIHETAGLTRYAIAHRIIESGVQVTIT